MLSIIIPTYNEEKYLPKLLQSIKDQDFTDYEIIVSDAGSKDTTVEIAKQYGCTVVKGGVLTVGRNNGARAAKGDTLLFLDSDVVLPPHFLKKAMANVLAYDLGAAGFAILPLGGNWIDWTAHRFLNTISNLTQRWIPYATAAILSKKAVHEAIRGFDETIVFIEDYPYAKAAAKAGKYRFFKNLPFYTSVRRYEKDGRFTVYGKYFLGQLYMLFFGPIRTDIFKYKFGHYKDEK